MGRRDQRSFVKDTPPTTNAPPSCLIAALFTDAHHGRLNAVQALSRSCKTRNRPSLTTLHVSRAPPHGHELTTDRATAFVRNRDPSPRNLTIHPFAGRDLHYARSPTRAKSSVRFTSPTRRRVRTRDGRHIRGPGSSRVDDVPGRGIYRDLSRAATAPGRYGDYRTWLTGKGATTARSQRVRSDHWPIHGATPRPYPAPTGNGSAVAVDTNPHRVSSVPRGHAGHRAGERFPQSTTRLCP